MPFHSPGTASAVWVRDNSAGVQSVNLDHITGKYDFSSSLPAKRNSVSIKDVSSSSRNLAVYYNLSLQKKLLLPFASRTAQAGRDDSVEKKLRFERLPGAAMQCARGATSL